MLLAVDPNKKHDAHQGDSEGCIASLIGKAWERILDRSGVGFKEYHAWVTVQKCSKLNPAFQNALCELIKGHKDDSLGEMVENNAASKDSLEEAISSELCMLFGKAIEQEIGRMPANDKWEEWLSKHNKRMEVNAHDLTMEDLKMRRSKRPQMSQKCRMKMLYALRRGEIIIRDVKDSNNVEKKE